MQIIVFYFILFSVAAILMIKKAVYETALYNERKKTNITLLKYMFSDMGSRVSFPTPKLWRTEKEKDLIKKANQCLYTAYVVVFIAVAVIGAKFYIFLHH